MLDKQIYLFKVDTNAFLTETEKKRREYLLKLHRVADKVARRAEAVPPDTISKYTDWNDKLQALIVNEKKDWKHYILTSAAEGVEYNNTHEQKRIRKLDRSYIYQRGINDGEEIFRAQNIVGMFESTLSRSFGVKTNDITDKIFILEIYYYDIAQDLILNGFDYNGNHYVYFSSSAGQIRTKKAVFVEETSYEACKMKLMCGLTEDEINRRGGMNVN